MLGLGVFSFARTDPPEIDGWFRYLFGTVFATVALGMAAFVWGRLPWWLWSSGVLVAVAFGWVLPLLAVD